MNISESQFPSALKGIIIVALSLKVVWRLGSGSQYPFLPQS